MKKQNCYVRISELSRLSGVSTPRIRTYIEKGIVPNPIKAGKTVAYYTDQHLERLKLIKEMQEEKISTAILKKMIDSINEIKDSEQLEQVNFTQTIRNKILESNTIFNRMIASITGIEGEGEVSQVNVPQIIKNKIIDSCIPIFRKKGYERITITDIAKAAGIGRNTFYQYFKDKKELFIECLSKLFLQWKRERLKYAEVDLFVLIKDMFIAFQKVYPKWNDMISLFRASAIKYPADFADRLEQTLNMRINFIADDIKSAIQKGQIREVNPDLLAIMVAGVSELVCYYIYRGKFGNEEPGEIADQMLDIWTHGIKKE